MLAQLTPQQKAGIATKMRTAYQASGFTSVGRYAKSIGITPTDFTNIDKGRYLKNDALVGVGKWLRLAHRVGYELSPRRSWQTADTMVARAIRRQLEMCAGDGLCAMFSDEPGIGKSHTVKEWCANTPNAFYVHGGHYHRKLAFIRALGTAMGMNPDRVKIDELLNDIIAYLKVVPNPVIVIDEAGDLHDMTYLLIKRLYNELEFVCGIYMIGGPGLKKRINSALRNHTNGFAEVYSRFGSRFTSVLPQGAKERKQFLRQEAEMVAKANGLSDPERTNRMLSREELDLRIVRREVLKSRIAA